MHSIHRFYHVNSFKYNKTNEYTFLNECELINTEFTMKVTSNAIVKVLSTGSVDFSYTPLFNTISNMIELRILKDSF